MSGIRVPESVVETMARDWIRRVAKDLSEIMLNISTEVPREDLRSETNFVPDKVPESAA